MTYLEAASPSSNLRKAGPLALALFVALGAAIGFTLSQWPAYTSASLMALGVLGLIARSQVPIVIAFIAFLVVQDPLVFLSGGEESAAGQFVKHMDELLLILYSGVVIAFNARTKQLMHAKTLLIAIGACYFGIVASTLLHGMALMPALIDLLLFSKPFLLLAVGASISLTSPEIRKLVNPLTVALLAVVLFAVVFLLFPQLQDAYIGDFRAPDERVGIVSAQGFFDGPGPYSWFCGVSFAFTYAAYLIYQRKSYLIASITSALFLVLAWRRKSMAGLLLMLFVALLLRDAGGRRRTRALVALLLLCSGAAIALAPYFVQVVSFTEREYGTFGPLENARIALHYTSVLIARDHFPFGTGLATFGSHASRIYYSNTYVEYGLSNVWGLSPEFSGFITDTFWPMVLGEGGVISLAGYMLFLGFLTRVAWRLARSRTASDDERFLGTFALFVLVGSLLESTSSHIYDSTMQSAFVMLPMGALLSLRQSGGQTPP